MRDHGVALAGDDGLGIVVAILLAFGDELFHAVARALGEVHELGCIGVALEELDRVVAALMRGHRAGELALDVVEDVFDSRVKLVRHLAGNAARCLLGLGDKVVESAVLERRNHDDRAPEALGKRLGIDLVAVLLHEVGHVERHDHGHARLDNLEREVQVAPEVGGINDLDDHIGLAAHEVVARDALLGAVGAERVDAGKVGDDHALVGGELGLLLLDRNAGPVAHIAVLARDLIEQCGLTAVGVTCQRDMEL